MKSTSLKLRQVFTSLHTQHLTKILQALDLSIEDVGLNLEHVTSKDSPYYIKALQILNSATTEQELEYYYGQLKQAQKRIY